MISIKTSVQNFGRTFWSALTDPSAYREFRKKRFGQGAGYLYRVLVCTSLIFVVPAVVLLVEFKPAAKAYIPILKADLQSLYPPGLIVTMKDGAVSTNAKEPVFIEFPQRWKAEVDKVADLRAKNDRTPPSFDHLIAIDTKAHIEDFGNYNSLFFVTKTAMIYPNKVNTHGSSSDEKRTTVQYSVQTFENAKDHVISKETVDAWMNKALPYLDILPKLLVPAAAVMLFAGPFVVAGLMLIGFFLYLLVMSAVAMLLALVMRRKLRYGEVYRLSLYGLTPAIAYGVAADLLPGLHVWLLFSLIFLVWMGIVFSRLPKKGKA